MNRLISSIIFILLFVPTLQAENADDLAAIKETAFNYMDAWYQGDKKRINEHLWK
jgi:hypothetical protein